MARARTTTFVFDGTDYFVAHTDQGGVRFGHKSLHCIDFPPTHHLYDEALALTEETAEDFHDMLIETGLLMLA